MWKISKSFEFNYGHRIATQELNSEFSLDQPCKCRHLHGHTASIEVSLSGDELTRGMITDFNHLNWLKEWIAENIDHKFIMDRNDPMATTMFDMQNGAIDDEHINLIRDKEETGYVFDFFDHGVDLPDTKLGAVVREYYYSMFFVDFSPTSENLAKWIYDFVEKKMKPLEVEVTSVTWYESPNSKSVYSKK